MDIENRNQQNDCSEKWDLKRGWAMLQEGDLGYLWHLLKVGDCVIFGNTNLFP